LWLLDISNDDANLDDGAMWPTAFALKEMTAAEEARISALVKAGSELRTPFLQPGVGAGQRPDRRPSQCPTGRVRLAATRVPTLDPRFSLSDVPGRTYVSPRATAAQQ
jgi:hypothetical protein